MNPCTRTDRHSDLTGHLDQDTHYVHWDRRPRSPRRRFTVIDSDGYVVSVHEGPGLDLATVIRWETGGDPPTVGRTEEVDDLAVFADGHAAAIIRRTLGHPTRVIELDPPPAPIDDPGHDA